MAMSQQQFGYPANSHGEQDGPPGHRHAGPPGQDVTPTQNDTRPPVCIICSKPDKEVRHRHFSSKYGRHCIGVEKPPTYLQHLPYLRSYNCPTCMRIHLANYQPRVKLVLSTSTLHMWFAPPGQVVMYTETMSPFLVRRFPSCMMHL